MLSKSAHHDFARLSTEGGGNRGVAALSALRFCLLGVPQQIARNETVPGFNTGGVHDRAISVVFLTTRGACTSCASVGVDAFTVEMGEGVARGVSLTLGSADATGVGAVTASGAGELEAEGTSGSGSSDWVGLGSAISVGEFVLAGEATRVDTFATAPVASCCALVFCCTPGSCCAFALTLTNEIVIPSTGIAIAVPTISRIIFGCFARASELIQPLTQDCVFWLPCLCHYWILNKHWAI